VVYIEITGIMVIIVDLRRCWAKRRKTSGHPQPPREKRTALPYEVNHGVCLRPLA